MWTPDGPVTSVTMYANSVYQTCSFLVGHPLLFSALQLFEAEGVSKRIQTNLVKKITSSGHTACDGP